MSMAKRLSTGRNEVGMMSDLNELAEAVGAEVLGFDIEWLVETTVLSTRKRPDVEIRRADGTRELLVTGEAKRPETLKGLHTYVESEVSDALTKARDKGSRYAFTTNFLEIALFNADVYDGNDYLATVVGDRITLADEKRDRGPGLVAQPHGRPPRLSHAPGPRGLFPATAGSPGRGHRRQRGRQGRGLFHDLQVVDRRNHH
ncbi:hypothetical protein [Kocuria tytonis]|uniref:hypothetical protein n=1 Tax=Kocuria tytonis TaxID=2054280 RepID=UPI001314A0D3|nr:hypothetical protein [Kocuria tytonis]